MLSGESENHFAGAVDTDRRREDRQIDAGASARSRREARRLLSAIPHIEDLAVAGAFG
jgi:hypothetical protein